MTKSICVSKDMVLDASLSGICRTWNLCFFTPYGSENRIRVHVPMYPFIKMGGVHFLFSWPGFRKESLYMYIHVFLVRSACAALCLWGYRWYRVATFILLYYIWANNEHILLNKDFYYSDIGRRCSCLGSYICGHGEQGPPSAGAEISYYINRKFYKSTKKISWKFRHVEFENLKLHLN